MYRQLAADRIHVTVELLERRIGERFPEAGLRAVAAELTRVSRETLERIERIRRPHVLLRAGVFLLLAALAAVLVTVPLRMRVGEVRTLLDLVDALEATLGSAFFLGAMLAFLWTLELRVKRGRALAALHELRSLAHIVDMHQLTKDPTGPWERQDTASSPRRTLTRFELFRYFDYCSEMLSLIAKIAALYVQDLNDAVAVAAVDDVEALCTGLSRKIWQKIDLLRGGP